MSGGDDTEGTTVLNFIILALIRGSTPLMAYFAVSNLNSAGLVVALKCAISLVFFIITFLWTLITDKDVKRQCFRNFRDKHTYWKLGLLGLIQGAAPYLLVVYSLQFLPPTLLGVFMAATPWLTIILERLPFIKVKSAVTSLVKLGMIMGFTALLLIMAPILQESLLNKNCKAGQRQNVKNTTSEINITDSSRYRTYSEVYDICLPAKEVAFGTISLVSGALLWATATVFWRSQKGNIHFLVTSLGQNFVAGALSVIFWITIEKNFVVGEIKWHESKGITGIVFLGMMTGWLATLIAQYLSHKIGPKPTNQVLSTLPMIAFFEDCVFVKSVVTLHPWLIALEIIGLLLLSAGTFMTNLPQEKPHRKNSLDDQLISHDYISEVNSDEKPGNESEDLQKHISRYGDAHDSDTESHDEEEIPTTWRNEIISATNTYPPIHELKRNHNMVI